VPRQWPGLAWLPWTIIKFLRRERRISSTRAAATESSDESVQNFDRRQESESDSGKYFRWDHEMRRDRASIIDAAKSVKLSVPLVVRLEGRLERGQQM